MQCMPKMGSRVTDGCSKIHSASRRRLQKLGFILNLRRCQEVPQQVAPSATLEVSKDGPTVQSHNGTTIKISPEVSLFDQPVAIKVDGLPKGAKVTLHLVVDGEFQRKPVQYVSCGHYVSSPGGQVDVCRDSSVGGTYTGVEPMGLFWSMEPNPTGPHNIRLVLRHVDRPLLYRLTVYTGHLSLRHLHMQGGQGHQPAATATVTRMVKSPDVRRIPVKEGGVRGTLFLPKGPGPFPGVIDMFGIAGGIMEFRAAMLASHGFAALSLPLFNYDDLPTTLLDVDFAYFEEAVKWLSSHPSVCPGGIGAVAVSGGAVVAIVTINTPTFCITDMKYNGKLLLAGATSNPAKSKNTQRGVIARDAWVFKPENIIPLWESSTQVLMIVSENDGQVNPDICLQLYDRYPRERRHLIDIARYPGAGHLVEPPYTPHCYACCNPNIGRDLLWGGIKREHAQAQDLAWHRAIDFFRKHLPQ